MYINFVDYYINTIYDTQNEKDLFGHCNVFEYNIDFVKVFFKKSDGALLVFVILDNNVSLY